MCESLPAGEQDSDSEVSDAPDTMFLNDETEEAAEEEGTAILGGFRSCPEVLHHVAEAAHRSGVPVPAPAGASVPAGLPPTDRAAAGAHSCPALYIFQLPHHLLL